MKFLVSLYCKVFGHKLITTWSPSKGDHAAQAVFCLRCNTNYWVF